MDKIRQRYQQVEEFNKHVHRVFAQTQDGKDLLDIWKDHLMTSSAHMNGSDLYQLGLSEGRKEFIRDIINQIKQAEAKA